MSAKITALYAVPLSFLFVVLSYRVIGLRKQIKAALGDGGDKKLARAIRVQANFAEYTPFAVVLLGLAEINGAPVWSIHLLGLVLLAGRAAHAWGVSQTNEDFRFRVVGMSATFAVLVFAAILAALA